MRVELRTAGLVCQPRSVVGEIDREGRKRGITIGARIRIGFRDFGVQNATRPGVAYDVMPDEQEGEAIVVEFEQCPSRGRHGREVEWSRSTVAHRLVEAAFQ